MPSVYDANPEDIPDVEHNVTDLGDMIEMAMLKVQQVWDEKEEAGLPEAEYLAARLKQLLDIWIKLGMN